METVAGVEKQKTVFSTPACKTPAGVSHSFHRLYQSSNNKTGHFICYKNRTFSFATDIDEPEDFLNVLCN